MPRVRALSPKTIEACRISLECFPGYLAETGHTGREHVSFDHFDRQHLKAWLAWMTDHQGYAPKSVTLRLSAVKAFLAYAAQEDITLIALSQAARALKAPAQPRKPVAYLTPPQIRAILAAHTGTTARSRRNRMLLILLYDTAARVSEITGLTLHDLRLGWRVRGRRRIAFRNLRLPPPRAPWHQPPCVVTEARGIADRTEDANSWEPHLATDQARGTKAASPTAPPCSPYASGRCHYARRRAANAALMPG